VPVARLLRPQGGLSVSFPVGFLVRKHQSLESKLVFNKNVKNINFSVDNTKFI
jgi:hypothetical protein